MMQLAIDQLTGTLFGGNNDPSLPMPPGSFATLATYFEDADSWKKVPDASDFSMTAWVFVENTFDPATRLRRGTLYVPDTQGGQPQALRVAARIEDHFYAGNAAGARVLRQVYRYHPCTELLRGPAQGLGATIALGTKTAATLWRVVQAELVMGGAVMVTLKAKSALGVLPEIAWELIDELYRADVKSAFNRALDAAHRESPTSVIDQCRNAISISISRWLAQAGAKNVLEKDLAEVSKAIGLPPHDRACVARMGEIVAKLHSRGKDSERLSRKLRSNIEEDAELAVHGLGFVVRELGWAKAEPRQH